MHVFLIYLLSVVILYAMVVHRQVHLFLPVVRPSLNPTQQDLVNSQNLGQHVRSTFLAGLAGR